MRHIFATFFVLCLCNLAVHAEEWKSDDGLLSFTVPENFVRDVEIPLQQHQLQHWKAKEDTCFLTVMRVLIPDNTPDIDLKDFLKGFHQNLVDKQGKPFPNIKILHSSSGKAKEGFSYCDATMSFWFPALEKQVYIRQYAVLISGKVYKISISSYTEDPQNIPAINECIASVKINATPKKTRSVGKSGPLTSAIVGGLVAFLFALIIYPITRAFQKQKVLPQTEKSDGDDTPFDD